MALSSFFSHGLAGADCGSNVMTIATCRIAYGTALFREASFVNIFVRSSRLPALVCVFEMLQGSLYHVLEFEQMDRRLGLLDIRLKNGKRGTKQHGKVLLR